jgi:hypothetical protein
MAIAGLDWRCYTSSQPPNLLEKADKTTVKLPHLEASLQSFNPAKPKY